MYKVGDRVLIVKDEVDDGHDVGKFGTIIEIDTDSPDFNFTIKLDSDDFYTKWYSDSFVGPKILNSPLYKAMNEEDC